MGHASDAEVIGRSLAEPQAFGLIYDRHASILLRFLGRRVGSEVGESLLHETFRIAFERRKSYETIRPSALPWLYGIASNLLLKHRRSEARRLRASARMAAGALAAQRRSGSAELEAHVLLPKVAEALDALGEAEREALLLYAWEDLSYPEIAQALELPIGTVRSRLSRARARLRELLGESGKARVRSR
jgi:RNA polymerase sigma-70 factor (ECF subfamily)